DGKGQAQIDLPQDLFGTVQLAAYTFDRDGLPVRQMRTLYIRPARQVAIKTTLDRDEYRPGGQAKLLVALTDGEGKPVPGALSLTAVDEAVFHVLDAMPGMEKTFYLVEQELLKPIYTLYPWSPERPIELPPAERNQFEQALFARTTRTEHTEQGAFADR